MNDTTRAADLATILAEAIKIMTPDQVTSLQAGVAFSGVSNPAAALATIASLAR